MADVESRVWNRYAVLLQQVKFSYSLQAAVDHQLVRPSCYYQQVLLEQLVHEDSPDFFKACSCDVQLKGVWVPEVEVRK